MDNTDNEGRLENLYAKHPLTNENLPIIVLDNKILEKTR